MYKKQSSVYGTKFGHANTARIMEVKQDTPVSTDKGIHQINNEQAISVHCQVIQRGGNEFPEISAIRKDKFFISHKSDKLKVKSKVYESTMCMSICWTRW
jgi:hypothetical protein